MKRVKRQPAVVCCMITALVFMWSGRVLAGNRWKPQPGFYFPSDVSLMDHQEQHFDIEDLSGKVVLFEVADMNSPIAQALAGAHRVGALGDVEPMTNLRQFEEAFPAWTGGVSLEDSRVALVTLLREDMDGRSASSLDARNWRTHFGANWSRNRYVLAEEESKPGFPRVEWQEGYLILDRNLVIRTATTSRDPVTELSQTYLPAINYLLAESGPTQWSQAAKEWPLSGELAMWRAKPERKLIAVGPRPGEAGGGTGRVSSVSDGSFKSRVLRRRGVTIVDFYATWCGPCKAFEPTYRDLAKRNRDIRFLRMDAERSPRTSGRYGVNAYPTIIVFRNGNEIHRWVGAPSAQGVQSILDRHT